MTGSCPIAIVKLSFTICVIHIGPSRAIERAYEKCYILCSVRRRGSESALTRYRGQFKYRMVSGDEVKPSEASGKISSLDRRFGCSPEAGQGRCSLRGIGLASVYYEGNDAVAGAAAC